MQANKIIFHKRSSNIELRSIYLLILVQDKKLHWRNPVRECQLLEKVISKTHPTIGTSTKKEDRIIWIHFLKSESKSWNPLQNSIKIFIWDWTVNNLGIPHCEVVPKTNNNQKNRFLLSEQSIQDKADKFLVLLLIWIQAACFILDKSSKILNIKSKIIWKLLKF